MEICERLILFIIFFIFLFTNTIFASDLKKTFENKNVSYLEFILSQIDNKLVIKEQVLTRRAGVQLHILYSAIGHKIEVNNKNQIQIYIKALMDKDRYLKKQYRPKNSDCNVVRNKIFFNKYGYGFFQKKNKVLNTKIMKETFVNDFLSLLRLSENEKNILFSNIYLKIQIISPIKNHNIACSGNLFQEELR